MVEFASNSANEVIYLDNVTFIDAGAVASTSQFACPAGTYQPSTGQTSCIDADAGYYVASTGAASQTACPAGTYQPLTGQTSCIDASAGYYAVSPVLEGFESGTTDTHFDWTWTNSTACSNTWQLSTDLPINGSYSLRAGPAGSQNTCETSVTFEYYSVGGTYEFSYSVDTEAHHDGLFFCLDNLNCTREYIATNGPPTGTEDYTVAWAGHDVSGTYTANLSAGDHTFTWVFGKDSIWTCNSGQSGNCEDSVWIDDIRLITFAAATSQTPCAAGTYQPSTAQTSCVDADAGHYVASAGSTSQTACVAGTYQPSTAQSSCIDADA
ncbi:MAG: hypothetical protein VX239_00410, partial [Candidatus Thermoplasmatota archaeon]|nr:hypothetical protein [Candidatus Thermoplasmatota archaeon]